MAPVAHSHVYLARVDRACALAQALTVLAVWRTSTVGVQFWHFQAVHQVIAVVYLAALLAVTVRPSMEYGHAAAAMTGVLWWFGRGGAFAELWLAGQSNLLGSAVRDGIGGTAAVLTIHTYGMYRARRLRAVA